MDYCPIVKCGRIVGSYQVGHTCPIRNHRDRGFTICGHVATVCRDCTADGWTYLSGHGGSPECLYKGQRCNAETQHVLF